MIIYSYPTYGAAKGSDLLLASRFEDEPVGPAKTINLALDSIASYIVENHANNLNQVLTEGNESLLNAKIGQLYLWDNPNNQYSTIRITDSAFIIEGIQGITGSLLQIEPGIFNIKLPNNFTGSLIFDGITANRNYALPNKSGTIALTSDIPTSTNYGLFAQTANSVPVAATTVETTLIGAGVGTLTVPANGFKVGDSFRAVFGGILNAGNNQTIRIRVKSGSVVLLDSGAQPITNITNNIFSFNIDFTIRQLGAAGVASIVSLGSFHYKKTSNNTVEGFAFNVINNTTFNTTINNTLDVTVQWGSNNASNSIYSDIFVLNKTY